ncbi:MAG: triosephosphate isomerase [Pseudomonadales bacterium]|nr:triosephosphate isomerase [Pseudomonadales bacterium]
MKKLVIANWKSHKTLPEVKHWIDEFEDKLDTSLVKDAVDIVIAPSDLYIAEVADELDTVVALGAQDVSPYPTGKYTGATAASQLASMGVKYAIVGHSERRQYFGEDYVQVANKVEQCIDAGITPVVCVDDEYVSAQAAAIRPELHSNCVIAYEALSAIGTGNTMNPAHVADVRDTIKEVFGDVPVLYGGSVTSSNVTEYAKINDGWLIGGASLTLENFWALLTAVANVSDDAGKNGSFA